ncbi:MAG: phosphoglycolate phosphatase [Gemmobacter sp.]
MTGAVVFDLDGTLIDSAPDIHAATNALLAEDGIAPLSFDTVRGFIGKGVPNLVARVLETLGEDPAGPRHAAFVRRFEARYETAVGLTVAYPGVVAALERLTAAGLPLGICTNKPVGPTRAVLDHLRLTRFFGTIVGGDSLPVRKPDPAPLLRAFADLGARPLLYVGDSEVDEATARAADLPFALFTEGYRRTPVAAMVRVVDFDHFDRLADFVLSGRAAQASGLGAGRESP